MPRKKEQSQNGFTIVELLVSVAVFAIVAVSMLGVYSVLSRSVKMAREKTVIASLSSNYLEIVRNMPFSQIGTISGNPPGQLADYDNAVTKTIEGITYKVYYEITYIDDPADGLFPTDPAGGDYKQVKVNIINIASGKAYDFVTNVVPQSLEGVGDAGALRIVVFNSVGQPVPDADIRIESPTTTPTMVLDRHSDSNGEWVEVNLPPRVNGYRITVSKPGYSTDRTYPITASNPNPIKPDATLVAGKVTLVSFSIDLQANLNIKILNQYCQNIGSVNVNVKGTKLLGTSPDVLKFNNNYSSVNGLIALENIEWDTYTPTLLAGQPWVIRGTSPIQKIDVLPGTTQTFSMILDAPITATSLMVIVKDASTKAPLEGALVHLHKGGSVPQDYYGYSGGSVWVQNSWKGGSGIANWSTSTPTRYYRDDGNIDINSNPTGVRLRKTSGRYALTGWLESSSFDTGTANTNFTILAWEPTSQDPSTTLKFQIASNNDNATWDYVGPDGTASTYYTTSGAGIAAVHNNERYVRYKAFLSTGNDRKTPVLTSLKLNYVSGCYTPGQVFFPDLTQGNNYDLDVNLAGYQTQVINSLDVNGNQNIEVLMNP